MFFNTTMAFPGIIKSRMLFSIPEYVQVLKV